MNGIKKIYICLGEKKVNLTRNILTGIPHKRSNLPFALLFIRSSWVATIFQLKRSDAFKIPFSVSVLEKLLLKITISSNYNKIQKGTLKLHRLLCFHSTFVLFFKNLILELCISTPSITLYDMCSSTLKSDFKLPLQQYYLCFLHVNYQTDMTEDWSSPSGTPL